MTEENFTKENFSFEMMTDPKKFFMDMLKKLILFMAKVIIVGMIIHFIMEKTGLTDDHSIKNYVKYLVIGSIVLYIVSMANMVLDTYLAGAHLDTALFKKFVKYSLFAPVFVLVHTILLFVCGFLQETPEIGIIIHLIAWTSFGIVLVTGIAYSLTYDAVLLAEFH